MAEKVYKRGMLVCLRGTRRGEFIRYVKGCNDFVIDQVGDNHVIVCAVNGDKKDCRQGKPFKVSKSKIIEGLTKGAGYDD